LIDINGTEITTPETTGELVYRGDNVTFGYAECGEDLIKGDENHGKLITGDMAKFDKDGFFYIVGRKKRFLKIFGNRVNLDETERLIKTEFSDCEIACSGKDDLMKIYSTNAIKNNDIINFLALKTGLNRSAFEIVNINSIPKSEAGKTLYTELA